VFLTEYVLTCFSGGDSAIADCDALLSDAITYDVTNDITDQRDALIEFYNATGGEYWTSHVLTTTLRADITAFEAYLVELGDAAAESNFSLSALSTDYQAVYAAVDALSVNCTLQRTLQLVNLLVKYPWNTASK